MGLLNHYYDKFSGKDKNGKKKQENNPIHTEKVLDPLKGKLLEDEKFRTAFIVGLVFLVLWGTIDSLRKYANPLSGSSLNTNISSVNNSFDTSEIMQAFQEELASSQDLKQQVKSTLYDRRREEIYISEDEIILLSGKVVVFNVPEGYRVDLTTSKVNEVTYVGNRVGKDCTITIKALEKIAKEDAEKSVFTKYYTQEDIARSNEKFAVSEISDIKIGDKNYLGYTVYDTREEVLVEKTYLAYFYTNAANGVLYIEINGADYLEDSELENLLNYEVKDYDEEAEKQKLIDFQGMVEPYTISRTTYPSFPNFNFATNMGETITFKGGSEYRIYSNTDINSLSISPRESEEDSILYKSIIIKDKSDVDQRLHSEEYKLVTEAKMDNDDPDYNYSTRVNMGVGDFSYKGFKITNFAKDNTRYILYGSIKGIDNEVIKVDIKSKTELKEEELKKALSLELNNTNIETFR